MKGTMPEKSDPIHYYWKQCYQLGDRTHWALCDTKTDSESPPHRVTCLEMIQQDHWTHDFPNRFLPKLIVELLNKHEAEKTQ